jgi:hypothetical protein
MPKIKNIERLIKAKDINDSIIKLDNFVAEACAYGDELEKLTEPQKNFYFNQSLEREINNGGFHQFFLNSSGDFATETILSLTVIGAVHTVPILQEAIDQFPQGHVPKDQTERQNLIEKIEDEASEIWNKLDQRFFEYQDNLNQLNMNYVRENSSYF